MKTCEPMTEERLKEIEARAAECVRNAQEASPGVWTEAETVACEDVQALVAEVRRLRSEIRHQANRARSAVQRGIENGAECWRELLEELGRPPKLEGL